MLFQKNMVYVIVEVEQLIWIAMNLLWAWEAARFNVSQQRETENLK